MAADGASRFHSSVFVLTLSAPDLAGVMTHEVMQPVFQLHIRQGGIATEPARHMAVGDAINPLLECGLAEASGAPRVRTLVGSIG